MLKVNNSPLEIARQNHSKYIKKLKMRITLFTANKNRHNYFINLLSEVTDELFVVQECGTIMPVPKIIIHLH